MKRMVSKKSHSWWWDSHISPKNSKWLADNLQEMDRCVKEMLKLIEDEGDSFAKKAEMYYQRRPELISHVEDFYRMYRSLAERYDQVTGELRKNIQSKLHSQGSASSDLGSEPPSPSPSSERTPDSKQSVSKYSPRPAGSEVFLGSGGSSDQSKKGSDGSSSSSESESDSDDAKELNGDGHVMSSELHQRIIELENELCIVKEKLHEHEERKQLETQNHMNLSSTISVLENEFAAANEKLRVSEAEILRLQEKIKEKNFSSEAMSAEFSYESVVLSELETRVVMLETELTNHKREIEGLKEAISARDQAIEHYKTQLTDASENFLQEKLRLELDNVKLEGMIKDLEAEVEKISQEKLQLEATILEQLNLIEELKDTAANSTDKFLLQKSFLEEKISVLSESNASLEAKVLQLEVGRSEECVERNGLIAELNQSIDELKIKVDILTAEKEELSATVTALNEDIKRHADRAHEMDKHLHHLHLEHAKLIAEIDKAKTVGQELRERVKELEEEVNRQKAAILEGAEEKREAIRQLCFSLEHYRNGYHNLRQRLQGHGKPPTVMAS